MTNEMLNNASFQLNEIRQNQNLLENYRYQIGSITSKQNDRLMLNIALYNDFQLSDYPIAKFLFDQELLWRKDDTAPR